MNSFENFGNAILLKDRVYNALKTEIILGNFKPGERLNILSIANKMNISSAPIREALNMLSKDGLIDLMPHKQAAVAAGGSDEYKISVDIRKMLEPYAAKISTPLIPQNKIDAVRNQLNSVLDDPSSVAAYVESDMAVHELLHYYAGSKFLSEILTMIKTYTMRFRYIIEKTEKSTLNREASTIIVSTHEHLSILDALESRDPERVYSAVLQHIEHYSKRNKPV
ncbi:MAG TPA: GntR family transcriptional regulator [Bacillota bacterium]|nr:GntR family transcriptional regulator [Bacillota bacterium]